MVPADSKYRTDLGLLTKGTTRIATVARRFQAVDGRQRSNGVGLTLRLAGEIPASERGVEPVKELVEVVACEGPFEWFC